jgi:hypothetical protein
MICRTFFHLSGPGDSASSSAPRELPAGQVWSDLVACLADEDDYVGLMDTDDNVLQITREPEDDTFRVELLMTSRQDALSQVLSGADTRTLLQRLPSRFTPASLAGFGFGSGPSQSEAG